MKLILLCPSQFKDSWFTEASQHYSKKIALLFDFELVQLKSAAFSRDQSDQKINSEEEALLRFLQPSDKVFVMDETGKSLNTLTFAKKLDQLKDSLPLKSRVIFIIGGPYGISDKIFKMFPEKFSLSSFTLAHPVAILVLMEQFYRAGSILKGTPYHNS